MGGKTNQNTKILHALVTYTYIYSKQSNENPTNTIHTLTHPHTHKSDSHTVRNDN